MLLILLVAGSTLVASFLCSLFEAVLYSVTPSQIEVLKKSGSKGALRLAELRSDVEEPIAAILTINTVAHTIGSAVCGALVAERYGADHPNAVAVFAAIFTFLVLGLTEIIPKSMGVRYARRLGPVVAMPIQWMVWISYPIARPSKAVMQLLTGGEGPAGPSEDELVLFSELAKSSGGVRPEENRWVRNALRLDQSTASDLRTPRPVVTILDADATVADATRDPKTWVHSRIPVAENGDPDRIIGVVYRRDVFTSALQEDGGLALRKIMQPLTFVPETTPAHELLSEFISKRRHMVAVVDEYGGFEGVVTLEDVLEQLLGQEIVDEFDEHDDMQEIARERLSGSDEADEADETDEADEPTT
ncbi:Hemolysin C [Planctomycetes bacterium Poly30]|uniref:Hemolysin C n=1 Tax=Saltatorellus ferox TaxID=2528018 RepID=A0A518EXI7_9BACT|nr:Hemolysin C [Planctomycetes bacterium Poly30]